MFDELKKMNEELAELKKNHLERSKTMFTEVAKEVFEKHPAMKSFSWNQYTPYFNDGEECVFSANINYLDINEISSDDAHFDRKKITDWGGLKGPDGKYPEIDNPDYNPDLAAAEKDAKEFLANIDESVLRDMFGDHVRVTATANGTDTEEYEHE